MQNNGHVQANLFVTIDGSHRQSPKGFSCDVETSLGKLPNSNPRDDVQDRAEPIFSSGLRDSCSGE